MTKTAKILLTLVILAAIGFGAWRWKDKLAPAAVNTTMDQAAVKQQLDAQKAALAAQAVPDITSKLLAGTNAAALVSAAKKHYGELEDIVVEIDRSNGAIHGTHNGVPLDPAQMAERIGAHPGQTLMGNCTTSLPFFMGRS